MSVSAAAALSGRSRCLAPPAAAQTAQQLLMLCPSKCMRPCKAQTCRPPAPIRSLHTVLCACCLFKVLHDLAASTSHAYTHILSRQVFGVAHTGIGVGRYRVAIQYWIASFTFSRLSTSCVWHCKFLVPSLGPCRIVGHLEARALRRSHRASLRITLVLKSDTGYA